MLLSSRNSILRKEPRLSMCFQELLSGLDEDAGDLSSGNVHTCATRRVVHHLTRTDYDKGGASCNAVLCMQWSCLYCNCLMPVSYKAVNAV